MYLPDTGEVPGTPLKWGVESTIGGSDRIPAGGTLRCSRMDERGLPGQIRSYFNSGGETLGSRLDELPHNN